MADMLSQEEIDALLGGGGSDTTEPQQMITDEEKDALGEIGNISMGTAATTLFTLLGQKVTITTPKVSETTFSELKDQVTDKVVSIVIHYKVGISGMNLLILNEKDVKIITDLMMGGDGSNIADELTDLHLSAIGEAMNQMIGSSSTSLSEMLSQKIDISPPEAFYDDLGSLNIDTYDITESEPIVKIAFRMTVGDLIDSEIMQLMPAKLAKDMVANLMGGSSEEEPPPAPAPVASAPPPQASPVQQPMVEETVVPRAAVAEPMQQNVAPPVNRQVQPVNAQAAQFNSFDPGGAFGAAQSDISLIKDVPLEITVELGRTSRKISDILDFATGTVVELDRLVGDALDIFANGKQIAKGEVVVVDENYGIRITEIIVPEKRIK